MTVTRLQRKVLKTWWRCHTEGYRVGPWLRQCSVSWLPLLGMGVYSYFCIVPGFPAVGWAFIGLCLGACLRDIGYFQVTRRSWPVTQQVIDWKRVSEMIESSDGPATGSTSVPLRVEPDA